MLPETRYYSRDAMEITLLDFVLDSQCFARSQATIAYTVVA